MMSCEKSEADKYMNEAKRVLTDASGTEWVGTDDDMVYTLTLNTGGTYRIASTTSTKGTYQQRGRNITFEKKNFMSEFADKSVRLLIDATLGVRIMWT